MKNTLLVLGLVGAVTTAGAVVIDALFFPAPPDQCQIVAQFVTTSTDAPALHHPMSLAWSDGLLYVADTDGGAVRRYDPDGALVSVWSGFERPIAIAPTPRGVYVADFLTDRITVLDDRGDVQGGWGQHGTGPGDFDAPSGIAVDRRGDVYVADFYNHRVQKFTEDGRFLREWGGRGRWHGRFRFPTGVAVTPAGEVLVADGFNNRVQRFTSDGRYLDAFGGTGLGFAGRWPGWFALAKDVAVDRTGTIYVTDAFNGRLQTFTADGSLRAVWGDPQRGDDQVDYASGVAIAPGGHAYVADFYRSEIWEIACPATDPTP